VLWKDVIDVLDALEAESVHHWVAGGWGVDILVGSQTRAHRDLDLAVDTATTRVA
jgi:lincosamide nucleotidyltransferase A/C/D/E